MRLGFDSSKDNTVALTPDIKDKLYVYDRISNKITMAEFLSFLQEIQQYQIGGKYSIPSVNIDGKLYFDPNVNHTILYHRTEDAIMLLQNTIQDVGGW